MDKTMAPRCPGCGADMTMEPAEEYGVTFGWYYLCRRCGWQSPLRQTKADATDAAERRCVDHG